MKAKLKGFFRAINKSKRCLGMGAGLFLYANIVSYGQFSITESLKNNTVTAVTLGGAAQLTSGNQDPSGDGWLRLTPNQTAKVGWAVVNQSFPSDLGVVIDFEYVSWRPTYGFNPAAGADGFSVFLYDAGVSSFRIGGNGGSLGYANENSTNDISDGLSGGYIGIGIDEYGNFSNPTEGRNGGPGARPNAIAVRGSAPNYPYINGTNSLSSKVDHLNNYGNSSRPSPGTYYRKVHIELTPLSNGRYGILVRWKTSQNGGFVTLISDTLNQAPPPYLKLGFAASTGSLTNYHEVRNMNITTTGGVRIEKSVDKANVNVGDDLTYTVTVYNATPNAISNLLLTDSLRKSDGTYLSTSNFKIDHITFHKGSNGNMAVGYPDNQQVGNIANNYFQSNLHLAGNSSATFVIKGHVISVPTAGGVIKNSARLNPSQAGILDPDPTNNTASVTTQVYNPNTDLRLVSAGTNPCLNTSNGNTFTYEVSNIGAIQKPNGPGYPVKLQISLPSGLSFSSVSGQGWSVSGSGLTRTLTRIDSLASGYSYPQITVQVIPASGNALNYAINAKLIYQYDADSLSNNHRTETLYKKPSAPIVTTPVFYCPGTTAVALSATGNDLLWYTVPSGGVGSQTAPLPSTAQPEDTSRFYVSQRNGACESNLADIQVIIHPHPEGILSVTSDTLCQGEPLDLIFTATDGLAPYQLKINGADYTNIQSGDAVLVNNPAADTTYTLTKITDSNGCTNP